MSFKIMIRISVLLLFSLISPAMASKVNGAYCTQARDAAATRLQWALAHQHNSKLQEDDRCRDFRSEFYKAAITRQDIIQCEQDDIRERALQVIDAEIDAFNDLIAMYCTN